MGVIQYIVDLGASVMPPIVIFILGLLLRQGIGKSSTLQGSPSGLVLLELV